ncbi:MAG: methylmalonyl Co-A mutase-associated GTPase MeaB [Ignavibacteria bacterium]|nr:methylmalonyl Co-A mutase-associated GTPase MeaB [Ignavibacteria bacterium]
MDKDFLDKIISSDKRAVAKALTKVENEENGSESLLKELYKYTGKAHRIGITGPPGAGKSTLTNCLVKLMAGKGLKVGVIAVDPTSPYTGGALLGDRIRMQEIGLMENVFIRSMATRGSLGGLCKSVVEACDVLDASGKDFIIIETVGVGQSELDIAQTADTTIVVLVPESGDSVQAMKAGLMEIADIFVLNKSDREGADGVAATLRNIIHLKPPSRYNWIINVLKTTGSQNKGTEELLNEIIKHKDHLDETGFIKIKRKEQLTKKILDLVNNKLEVKFWNDKRRKELSEEIESISERKTDPYTFAENFRRIFADDRNFRMQKQDLKIKSANFHE